MKSVSSFFDKDNLFRIVSFLSAFSVFLICADSYGTTAVFTEYPDEVSDVLKRSVGHGKSVNWKTGIGFLSMLSL